MDWMWAGLLHGAASLAYFLLAARRQGRLAAGCETMVVLAVPVFGLLSLLAYHAACRAWHLAARRPPREEAEEPDVFTGGLSYDADIVPLNDAFLMDDAQKKRKFFTTAIKQDVVTNRSILRMAMGDSDRETAYYAVSLLTTRLEGLEGSLFAAEGALQGTRGADSRTAALKDYAAALGEYLSYRDFIDDTTYRQKQRAYCETLAELVALCPEQRSYYDEEIRQRIAMGDFAAAERACGRFCQTFPEEERAYLAAIRLYAAWRRPEKLREALAALKACPVELSLEAMRVIRFWDGEVRHG